MSIKSRITKTIVATAGALAFGVASAAVTINPITTTNNITDVLLAALLAPGSGITVVSASYQGVNTPTNPQSGTYTNFNLAPTSGSTPTLTMGNGILLTSGTANLPATNTSNSFNTSPGSGSNAMLTALAGTNTNDANVLTIEFTVDASVTAVGANFVFGTDEFPTQSVTDIFGFFVDGVNFAKFPNGQLISNTPGNPTNFILNPVGSGLYPIEFNGLTQVFAVSGLLGTASATGTHTLVIGIADTSDSIFQSGVFVNGLTSGTTGGCSGIGCGTGGGDGNVPEPASTALAGLALLAAVGVRARRRVK